MKEYFKSEIKKLKGKYFSVILLGTIINILMLGSLWLSKVYIDSVVVSNSKKFAFVFILSYTIIGFVRILFKYLNELIMTKISYSLLKSVRDKMYDYMINRFKISVFSNEKKGYIIKIFDDWICSVTWFISNVLLTTLMEVILLIMSITVVFIIDWRVFLFICGILPLYGIIYFVLNNMIRKLRKKTMDADVLVMQTLNETIDGVKEIKGCNSENNWKNNYSNVQTEYVYTNYKFVKLSAGYESLIQLINLIGHISIFGIGTYMIFNGNYTVGTVISLDSLINLLFSPVEKIINFNRLFQIFKVEYKNINSFLNENLEVKIDESNVISCENENVLMSLQNISFTYKSNKNKIFENVSVEFEKGKVYAVTGINGSGKSTLINLIMGFFKPDNGNIYFNGKNIFSDIQKYRKQIGYIPVNPYFINDTIKENILFKRDEYNENIFNELLNVCEINEFLQTNNISVDFIIGNNGEKLSAGQKQKLAMCRALLNLPNLLIIDEGTESIDVESEKRIFGNIQKFRKNITIIIISHRSESLDFVDEMLKIEENKLVKF